MILAMVSRHEPGAAEYFDVENDTDSVGPLGTDVCLCLLGRMNQIAWDKSTATGRD